MIKARAKQGKRDLLVFGIDAENVKRLMDGRPIVVNLAEMGLSGEMMIFYGATTGDLIKTIQPFISKDTIIRDDLD